MAVVTAAEAQASVLANNARHRNPVPQNVLDSLPVVYIHNIYNKRWGQQLGGLGMYYVPACEPGTEYSTLRVPARSDEYDTGDGNGTMASAVVMAEELGLAILGSKTSNTELSPITNNLEWWGCFMPKNEVPTKEELAAARKKLEQNMTMWVAEGDRKFMQGSSNVYGEGINSIEANHREAAQFMGQNREWAKPLQALVECPGCGEMVKPSIKRHGIQSCGWDFERKMFASDIPTEVVQESTPKRQGQGARG